MFSRREFMQAFAAATAILGPNVPLGRLAAQQKLTQETLLDVKPVGNVTIAHITDLHAQLKPVWFREPSVNLGVGEAQGKPPHLTGGDFLKFYDIQPHSPAAYAQTHVDFVQMARQYGQMGGIDRIATVLSHIRSERPGATLFLDGGDTWQGSYTALQTRGADMVEVMNALAPDAMTGHWEFTLGAERVKEIIDALPFAFLGANVFDNEWNEPVFDAVKTFERGGVKIAVIGQAFPYTPIANPRWMIPDWSFGIREEEIARHVAEARADGAELVVLLSHNGFDVDRKLAARVPGIDVILTGHTHDALPKPLKVNNTLLVATGSNGKFVSRLDLDVSGGELKGYSHRLIPIFADVIAPDKAMTALVSRLREPYDAELSKPLARTESLLYRRGNFNGTMDDLICRALLEQRDAEIALSPGFRWGPSLLPGDTITNEDLYSACAITYPAVYRNMMTGEFLKRVLEDVADNLFNPDPYYQQGGDMVRVGGMGYAIDPNKPIGERISGMTLLKDGSAIDPRREYAVAGWASINEDTEGPPIWDVVRAHLEHHKTVNVTPSDAVKVTGM